MDEKRIHARRTLSTEGELADALGEFWTPIKVVDISPGGVGFLSTHQLQPGSLRLVRLDLPTQAEGALRATLRVVHCVPHSLFKGYRIGAEFVHLDSQQIVQIARLTG